MVARPNRCGRWLQVGASFLIKAGAGNGRRLFLGRGSDEDANSFDDCAGALRSRECSCTSDRTDNKPDDAPRNERRKTLRAPGAQAWCTRLREAVVRASPDVPASGDRRAGEYDPREGKNSKRG